MDFSQSLVAVRSRAKGNIYLRAMRICLFIFVLSMVSLPVISQTSMPNQLRAKQIVLPIQLDGRLNEEIWKEAEFVSNFTQRELNFGEEVTERTEVAVLYDSKTLYIGVRCYDSAPNGIVAKEYRRDFNFDLDDNFQVLIDTYRDKRNGFVFVTNQNAARSDFQVFNNGGSRNLFGMGSGM